MRTQTQISVRYVEEVAIFDIIGYLTKDSEEDMDKAYERAKDSAKILLSFDRQSFITSSGFGLIVKLIWQVRSKGQTLRVVHSSDQVRKIFDVIGLAQSIAVLASEKEALVDF